ncbi:hypothetical protein RvY_06195 [Ramazzottius varieornatus]|uniref:FAM21/CAPZIP domain-containing protein n=1 Tax=Ramazzottius varieornatus TaxID=947166 RepID=A0A1D1V444_RAMVA|nr:hypothetical protein RvY_06195 [Ramazzottius varieornatus]
MDASSQASTINETFTDLYPSISKWTLAQDVALLDSIDRLSKKVAGRTEATSKNIHGIADQLNQNRVRLHSAINSFNSLSNTQFVESRVREDDPHVVKKGKADENDSIKPTETAEQKKMRELKEAITMTQAVMRDYFNVVEVNIEDSDDDDEESSRTPKNAKPTFREAKDPYLHRPLPYIIGTEEFNRDKYIGLRSQLQEKPRANGATEDEVVLSARFDDLLVQPNGHSSARQRTDSPLNVPASPPSTVRKSGVISSESEDDSSSDIFNTHSIKDSSSSKPSVTPSPTPGARVLPPSLTRSSSQASSAKTGNLFVDGDEEDSDLFSTTKVRPATQTSQANQVLVPPEPVNQDAPNQAKTIVKPPVAARTPSVPFPTTGKPPSKKMSIFADDDEDEDGLFSSRKVTIGQPRKSPTKEDEKRKVAQPITVTADKTAPSTPSTSTPTVTKDSPSSRTVTEKAKKKATLFDDESDEDLFTLPSVKVLKSTLPINEANQSNPTKVEKPSVKTRLPPVPAQAQPPPSSGSSSQSSSIKARNLFLDDDEEDDDLFSSKKAASLIPVVIPALAALPIKQEIPLPAPGPSTSTPQPAVEAPENNPVGSTSKVQPTAKKFEQRAMEFDNEDSDNDDLFALPSSNKTATKSVALPPQPTVSAQIPAITPRLTVHPGPQPLSAKVQESLPGEQKSELPLGMRAQAFPQPKDTEPTLFSVSVQARTVSQPSDEPKMVGESEKSKPRPVVRARTSLHSLPASSPSKAALAPPAEIKEALVEYTEAISEEKRNIETDQADVEVEPAKEEPPEVVTQPSMTSPSPAPAPEAPSGLAENLEGGRVEESLAHSPTPSLPQSASDPVVATVREAGVEKQGEEPKEDLTAVTLLDESVGEATEESRAELASEQASDNMGEDPSSRLTLNVEKVVKPPVSKSSEKPVEVAVEKKAPKLSLFDDDDNSDEDLFAPPSARNSSKTHTTTSSSASVKTPSISSSVVSDQSKKPPALVPGLFEDDSEEEDLFSIKPIKTPIKPTTAAVNQSKSTVSPPKVALHSPLMDGPPPLDTVESSESDDDLFK